MYALAEEIVGGIPDKYFFDTSKSGELDEAHVNQLNSESN